MQAGGAYYTARPNGRSAPRQSHKKRPAHPQERHKIERLPLNPHATAQPFQRAGRKLRIRSLQIRIAVALLLVLVQTAGLALINAALTRDTNRENRTKARRRQAVFNLLHKANSRQLAQSATILSADFAFREAAATKDRNKLLRLW
jgi:hypothetical protein